MKPRKNLLLFICAAVFFIVTVALRILNIYVAVIESDVTYDAAFVRTLALLHDGLALLAYGFSAAAVVYSARVGGRALSLKSAAVMSAVIFADRAFCLIYDVSVSNINIRETETLTTAVTWLLTDFLFFACMYFGGALIASAAEAKKAENGSEVKGLPLGSLGATAGIMTLLQLASQLVICIQFFMEYDDVTGTEKAQMMGDILWILVEYGGVLAASAMAFYALISYLHRPKERKKS